MLGILMPLLCRFKICALICMHLHDLHDLHDHEHLNQAKTNLNHMQR